MKKIIYLKTILLFILLNVTSTVIGQNNTLENEINHHFESGDFKEKPISLFSEGKQILNDREKFFTFKIDKHKLISVIEKSDKFISLEIPFNETENITLLLKKRNLLHDDFNLIIVNEKGDQKSQLPIFVAYTGIIHGLKNEKSLISIVFIDNTLYGTIAIGNREFSISTKTITDEIDYILYEKSESQASQLNFNCGTKDEDINISQNLSIIERQETTIPKCLKLHFEINKDVNDKTGGISQSVLSFLNSYNIIQTQFLNDNITVRLFYLKIWDTEDPYYNSLAGNPNAPDYADMGYQSFVANGGQIYGDVAILLHDFNSNLDGLAGGAPCAGNARATARLFNSGTIMHEIGHCLGSNHTHWCGWPGGAIDNCAPTEGGCPPGPTPVNGGTIMSYCGNLTNGFGPLPLAVITDYINNASCIESCDSAISCEDNIVNLTTITNTSSNGFTISWASNYSVKVYFKELDATNYVFLNTVTNPNNSYEISYIPSLNCEIQKFEIKLVAVCPNGDSKPTVVVYSPQRHLMPYRATDSFGGVFLCNTPNPTVNDLPIVGENLKFYSNENDVDPIPNDTAVVLNTVFVYYVSQTINGCESDRLRAVFHVMNHDVPYPNVDNTQILYCSNPRISDLYFEDWSYESTYPGGGFPSTTWWDSQFEGNNLLGGISLINNQIYYAQNQVYFTDGYSCTSPNRVPVQAVFSTSTPPLYTVPFTETFDRSLCSLGYTGCLAQSGRLYNNTLRIVNFGSQSVTCYYAITKEMHLTAGTNYYVSFKIKKMIENQNATLETRILTTGYNYSLGSFSTSSTNYTEVVYSINPDVSGLFKIRFNLTAIQGDGVHIDDLRVSTSLSNNESEIKKFVIYPNPASDKLIINSNSINIRRIEIYDLQGRLVKNSKINQREINYNISDLAEGTYVLRIYSDSIIENFKIIKK